MKRVVVCCDGTWNTSLQQHTTNVCKLFRAVAERGPDGVEQQACYVAGVGTRPLSRFVGGALGLGLSENVKDAYRFLVEHFEPGDELFFFGFSRGAYTARSLAGLVRNVGVLRSEHADRVDEAFRLYRARGSHPAQSAATRFRDAYAQETRIRCIGVWDTVGALGIPLSGLHLTKLVNRRCQFHDTELSSWVDSAFHAVAIDERRKPFSPTLWSAPDPGVDQQVEQVWFSGVHGDVGGGYREAGLSDIGLVWMADRAHSCGLAFRPDALLPPAVEPQADGLLHNSFRRIFALFGSAERAIAEVDPAHEYVATCALRRLETDPDYAPNLRQYREQDSFQELAVLGSSSAPPR